MAANRVIVYGGRGALGSKCVQHFKSKGWVSAAALNLPRICVGNMCRSNLSVTLTVGRKHRHGCKRRGQRKRDREDERGVHGAGGTGELQMTDGDTRHMLRVFTLPTRPE